MINWHQVKEKFFEVGGKVIGGIAESFGLSIGKKVFPPHGGSNHDSALAAAISNDSSIVKAITDTQSSLARVQEEQNRLKQAELMINVELARQERELKLQLCEIVYSQKLELQQKEFQNRGELQAKQIQADFDEKNLPTVFSRQELVDIFAQESDSPLFVCSKIQITEGSPKYFQTELAAEVESKMRTFANSTFKRDVRFYSRFFKDRDVFDADVEKLKSILPDTPCVMIFSRLTRSNVHFHYNLWGCQIAGIFDEYRDLEFSWREEFLQPLLDSVGEVSDHDLDNLYEMIGDWLTSLQKLIATFLMDLYAIVDGDNPFYIPKLDRVDVGLPEAVREKYIQPYAEILERIQKERIDAFNEELRHQQDEGERNRQVDLQKQQDAENRSKSLIFELPNGGGTLEFVLIPAGKLIMDGVPEINLPEFRISKYPITQRQYQAITGTNPSHFTRNYNGYDGKQYLAADRPVEQILWKEAKAFCEELSNLKIMENLHIQLPSPYQWEYACRGGNPDRNIKFWFGNNDNELTYHAWYIDNSNLMTHSVNERETGNTNSLGLVDMHGNIFEWCSWESSSETSANHPIKGGAFDSDFHLCSSILSAVVYYEDGGKSKGIGFRIVII